MNKKMSEKQTVLEWAIKQDLRTGTSLTAESVIIRLQAENERLKVQNAKLVEMLKELETRTKKEKK